MKNKLKFFSLLLLLIGITTIISACSSGSTAPDFYDLDLSIVNDGYITDGDNNVLVDYQDKQETFQITRNSTIELNAYDDLFTNQEFLFWTGHIEEFYGKSTQSIYMDTDKDMIAVFGDKNYIFMTGYVTESWGNSNVYGYWIAHQYVEDNLEIYVKKSTGLERAERYIYEDAAEGEIALFTPTDADGNPDTANYEYLAALWKYEESNFQEYDEEVFLFVYIDRGLFETLILEYNTTIKDEFTRISGIYDQGDDAESKQKFKEEIRKFIEEHKADNNMIIGTTVDIIEQ